MSGEKKQAAPPAVYEISAEGSLGLLALGARGLDLWRKKKAELNAAQNAGTPNPNPDEKK
jgi:hypothetical protein